MSMSALPVVIRPPEPGFDFDFDVETGDRFAPSTCVGDPACGALTFHRTGCRIRSGIPDDDETPPALRRPSCTIRPVLLCGDHRLTDAHPVGLGGGRESLVENLIYTVWRAEPMPTRSTAGPRQYF